MTTTSKFCLPADVYPFIRNMDGYTGDDAELTIHIQTATALIREYTRRDWERDTYVDFFDSKDINIAIGQGNGYTQFQLREKPVQSITSVKFNTSGDWTNTDPLESYLYELDVRRNRVIIYPTLMNSYGRSLRIEYVAGYEVNDTDTDLLDVAENLKRACAIQAGFQWQRVLNMTSHSSKKQDRRGTKEYQVTPSGLVAEALALIKGETRLLVGGNA